MKKLLAFLTVVAMLAIPVSAMAVEAADWELVGYTKLETYWNSVAVNKNLSGPLPGPTRCSPRIWAPCASRRSRPGSASRSTAPSAGRQDPGLHRNRL